MEYQRTCILCKYFNVHTATSDWSEVTLGEDFEINCTKVVTKNPYSTHFYIYGEDLTEEKFRTTLLTAVNCKDFEERTSE